MAILEVEAKVTDRYQTTVPAAIRRALRLKKHDRLVYKVVDEDTVLLSRREAQREDPVLGRFLDFLARDIASRNSPVRPVTPELAERVNALIGDVEVDLEAPLPPDDGD